MTIYKITNNINGKVYIGQTVRSVRERMEEHKRKCTTVIDKALRKYGAENFTVEEIDHASNVSELNEKEIYWIADFDSMVPKGYNQCLGGGNTLGYKHREESKRKMSDAKSISYVGSGNPFYGKTHSEESKKRMGDARKGLAHLTEEQVMTLRASHHKVRVRNIETGEVFESVKEAATTYNLKDTHITRVCKGKRKTTGNFHWCYEV